MDWADQVDDELSPEPSDTSSSSELADPVGSKPSWAQVVAGSAELAQQKPQEPQEQQEPQRPIEVPAKPVAVPGDPIGIRAVQSILMSATQMNLSHFHTAGMDTVNGTLSVRPSAADAMNGVYTTENTSMRFKSSANIRNIRMRLVSANLGDFVTTVGTSIISRENIWYEVLNVPMHDNILRFYIDYIKMLKHGLTLERIATNTFGNDCSWKVSPDFMGMIDLEVPDEHMSMWLCRMKKHICGTPKIMSCYGSDGNFVTRGTDILAVSKIPEIDMTTVESNNVTEVEQMFGIEAAAQVLFKLTEQHIVSDFMTRTGAVLPFNKVDEIRKSGLLTSIGFERPKDEIRRAIVSGDFGASSKDSVYEAIMTGENPSNNIECGE